MTAPSIMPKLRGIATFAIKVFIFAVILFSAADYFSKKSALPLNSAEARHIECPREKELIVRRAEIPLKLPATSTSTNKPATATTEQNHPREKIRRLSKVVGGAKENVDTIYQIQDERVFLTRPFYDDRHELRKIRFFGMQEQSSKVPLLCRFQLLDQGSTYYEVEMIRFALFPWWPDIRERMQAYSYDCFLGNTTANLTEVRVVAKGRNGHVTIPLARAVESKGAELALCLKCAHGVVNATFLVEWIEFNRLLGVEKFIVYDTAIHGPARRVLHHYESLGIVEVIPFHFPLTMLKYRQDLYGHPSEEAEKQLLEQAFLVCLNDCVYRYRQAHRYISVVDMDEIIIPTNPKENLVDMCRRGEREWPRIQGLRFDTSWHAEHYPVATGAPSVCYTQNHLRRTEVTPLQPKAIHFSSMVLAVNWHGPCEKYPKTMKNYIHLQRVVDDKNWGHTHHFRKCEYYEICNKYNKNNTVDSMVPRYRRALENRVTPVLEKLWFIKSNKRN